MYRTFKGKVVEMVGQQESIYKHLKTQGSISQLEALGVYGIYRLAARVCELRRKGVPIDSVNKKDANGKVYASYFLNDDYEWRTKPLASQEPVGVDEPHNSNKGYKVTDYTNVWLKREGDRFVIMASKKDDRPDNEQIITSYNIKTGLVTLPTHFNPDLAQARRY